MGKIKVLAYCDSPTIPSGFAKVLRNTLVELHRAGHIELTVAAKSYTGEPSLFDLPTDMKLYPLYNQFNAGDPYGLGRTKELLSKLDYDIFFSLEDMWVLQDLASYINEIRSLRNKQFKWIWYSPIDGLPLRLEWLEAFEVADVPVLFNDWTHKHIAKINKRLGDRSIIIEHAVDPQIFYKYRPDQKPDDRLLMQIAAIRKHLGRLSGYDDAMIVGYIATNSTRKWLTGFIGGIAAAYRQNPDIKLLGYIHTVDNIGQTAISISKVAHSFGIADKIIVPTVDSILNQYAPVSDAEINMLYNLFDVYLSTSLGEGDGLPIREAMAAGTPVMAPYNTSMIDRIKGGYIAGISCGGPYGHFTDEYNEYLGLRGNNTSIMHADMAYKYDMVAALPLNNAMLRPVPSMWDMGRLLCKAYNSREWLADLAKRGMAWSIQRTWDKVRERWLAVLRSTAAGTGIELI